MTDNIQSSIFIVPHFTDTSPRGPHWREEGLFSNVVKSTLTQSRCSSYSFSFFHTQTHWDKHLVLFIVPFILFQLYPLTANSAVFTLPLWSPWTPWWAQHPRSPDHNITAVWNVPSVSIQRHTTHNTNSTSTAVFGMHHCSHCKCCQMVQYTTTSSNNMWSLSFSERCNKQAEASGHSSPSEGNTSGLIWIPNYFSVSVLQLLYIQQVNDVLVFFIMKVYWAASGWNVTRQVNTVTTLFIQTESNIWHVSILHALIHPHSPVFAFQHNKLWKDITLMKHHWNITAGSLLTHVAWLVLISYKCEVMSMKYKLRYRYIFEFIHSLKRHKLKSTNCS